MLIITCSTAFAYGRAGSSSSYAPSSNSSSRVGSSSSFAYKPVYVYPKDEFQLKEYPWNSSRTILKYPYDDQLQAYAKYYDSGNGIFWIKVECPEGSGKFGWAGTRHFIMSKSDLEDLPYENFGR